MQVNYKIDKATKICRVGFDYISDCRDGYKLGYNLDFAIFLLGENDECLREEDFVFYNNCCSKYREVQLDDTNYIEDYSSVIINFTKISTDIKKIVVCICIFHANERKQNFSQLSDLYIRVSRLDEDFVDGEEFMRIDYEKTDFGDEDAIVFLEFEKKCDVWEYSIVNQSVLGGMEGLVKRFCSTLL